MFGGWNKRYKHQSDTLGCSMTFTVYYPPAAEKGKVPVRRSLWCPYADSSGPL